MLDLTVDVPPGQFLCKAINGATLTRLLAEIGDLERVILEPHPVTGNLVVYRLVDAETMRSIGYIDVSEETFEPWDTPTDYALPKGWRTAEREDAERWTESLVVCDKCGHRWVAVRPAGTDELECPSCHYRQLVDAS